MENLKFVTDVEGPVTNPGFDFAWLTLDSLSHRLKEKYYEKIKRFDEADDGIWLNERNEQGWSTGTTPIISQCLAACDGKTDDDLLAITKQKIVENKGIDEVIKFLKEEDIEQYFVTSSYPAVSLLLGYKYDIPSSHIHCSGHQLSGIEKLYFDSNRDLEKIRFNCGMLFQSGALLNWMSVADNIALPLIENTKLSKSEIKEKVNAVLPLVELEHAGHKNPSDISGGMKKRAGLARAIITEPEIVLYDEFSLNRHLSRNNLSVIFKTSKIPPRALIEPAMAKLLSHFAKTCPVMDVLPILCNFSMITFNSRRVDWIFPFVFSVSGKSS